MSTRVAGQVTEWGPFERYQVITNEWGHFAVESHCVMHLDLSQTEVVKGETLVKPVPVSRPATAKELAEVGLVPVASKPSELKKTSRVKPKRSVQSESISNLSHAVEIETPKDE